MERVLISAHFHLTKAQSRERQNVLHHNSIIFSKVGKSGTLTRNPLMRLGIQSNTTSSSSSAMVGGHRFGVLFFSAKPLRRSENDSSTVSVDPVRSMSDVIKICGTCWSLVLQNARCQPCGRCLKTSTKLEKSCVYMAGQFQGINRPSSLVACRLDELYVLR